MSLATVCAEIATVAGTAGSGIAVSLNEPPEVIGQFPTSWVNPVEGTVQRAGDAMWLHTVELIVYASPRRANLPVEFARLAPLVNSVEATFWAAYEGSGFSPNISKCLIDRYRFDLRGFAGKEYLAITFTLIVKEHTQ